MKSIFDYFDYQEFLREYYEYNKAKSGFFSYRYMGKALSLDPGFIVKVLSGKMHLAVKSIPAVKKFCKLKNREGEYFELLVKFGRAKTSTETKLYFEKLLFLRGEKGNVVEERSYAFYKKWYHTALWSLLGYYTFTGDFEELSKKLSPNITVDQARESIQLLMDLGFVQITSDGVYELADGRITTGDSWRSLAINNYQLDTMQLGQDAIDIYPKDVRDISTVSVAISHDDLMEIKERASDFRKSIMQLKTENTDIDSVYQVNIQIFPLTVI